MQVSAGQLTPAQAAPKLPSPFVTIHEVGEDIFGRPVDEDIFEYRP